MCRALSERPESAASAGARSPYESGVSSRFPEECAGEAPVQLHSLEERLVALEERSGEVVAVALE